MTTSFYLEHYLDSLDSLPGELRRNFTLMHDMDDKNRNILRDVDAASDEYLRKVCFKYNQRSNSLMTLYALMHLHFNASIVHFQVKDLNSDERKIEMEKIQRMFKKAKEFGDEKVSIAIQTYEMVDKHIRRLDGDLAKFEAEMREKGRLSQTETESEAEADDDNGDDTSNKKGPKKGRKTPGKTPTTGSNANKKRPKVLFDIQLYIMLIIFQLMRSI